MGLGVRPRTKGAAANLLRLLRQRKEEMVVVAAAVRARAEAGWGRRTLCILVWRELIHSSTGGAAVAAARTGGRGLLQVGMEVLRALGPIKTVGQPPWCSPQPGLGGEMPMVQVETAAEAGIGKKVDGAQAEAASTAPLGPRRSLLDRGSSHAACGGRSRSTRSRRK